MKSLWAKKRSENEVQLWLPLVAHLEDTQNVIRYLYDRWLNEGQRQIIAGGMSDEDAHKLVEFLGLTHDMGKATPVFQTERSYNGDDLLDREIMEALLKNGFSGLDDLELSSRRESPHARAGEALLEDFKVSPTVGAIIGGHHGKPADNEGVEKNIGTYPNNYYGYSKDSKAKKFWRDIQCGLFNDALEKSGYNDVKEIPILTQSQAVLLEGLLIMADWLASSECLNDDRDKPLFPLIELDQTFDDIDMEARFRSAMNTWELDDEWLPDRISNATDAYKERWGFQARPVQLAMTEAIGKAIDPGIAIVEAPMGIGKTEIALLAAEQMAYATGRDGLFVGLPTQSTSNAMFNRVEVWLSKMATEQQANYSIKLMHGKALFNKTYQQLPQASNILGQDSTVTINSWFSGKKSILSKFTIGTIDNLLLMGLKQRHLFLRHLGFSGKVVIIDEAHSYDVYMSTYLEKVLRWLGIYHVPVVILSATLPIKKRNDLILNYLKGKYRKESVLNAPDGWKMTQAYPLLSLLDGPQLTQVTNFTGTSDQKPTKVQVNRLDLEDSELIQSILNQLRDGGVAGVIVNTVKRAQSLARLVPDNVGLLVLHSAFLAPDRAKREDELLEKIGKHANRPQKLLVIGTQVLEQSLDIDFDVMYSDIAPMDLILQRIGRLHRHKISRPEELKIPKLYVMGIQLDGYGDGNEAVYGKYLLMKTDHFLPDAIELPKDISPLVQKVYDCETNSEIDGIEKLSDEFKTNQAKKQKKAEKFQIKNPKFKTGKNIHGWLARDPNEVNNDSKAAAAVRDIKESLEVILTRRIQDKDYLLDGRELSMVSPKEIAEQTIRIPNAITPDVSHIERTINELENMTSRNHAEWKESVWLKGAVTLILDQEYEATLGDWRLKYSASLGLSYEKEE